MTSFAGWLALRAPFGELFCIFAEWIPFFSGVRAGGAALCAEAGDEESRKDRIPGCS